MEQMSIYCTLLGVDDEDMFSFMMSRMFEDDSLEEKDISPYMLIRFVLNVLKKSGRFDSLITNGFITKMIKNNNMMMFDGTSSIIRVNTLSDMLKIDIRNPIILLRYFLSFEKPDNMTKISMIKDFNIQHFFMLFHNVLTRCITRSAKMDKLIPICKRLEDVRNNLNSMYNMIH